MEFKAVKVVEGSEPKGVAETEAELLRKHEEQQAAAEAAAQAAAEAEAAQQAAQQPADQPSELKEEDVLSYIGKRYNKQINSFDELMAERSQEQLPEDVAEYMKYKKETGRGFQDFLKLREDFDSMDQDELLHQYLSTTQPELDSDDISSLMDEYRYDEDIDDESTIKRAKIAKKKIVAEAKKFFNAQKEKYKAPLESSSAGMSNQEREEFEAYRNYVQQARTIEEENNRKREWFMQKTNDVFSGDFKGFEFTVDNRKITYTPGDANELKKLQSDPMNFIGKFLDENGLMKDAPGYHRALAIAMNPEKFAKHFYEQGKADATDGTLREIKNINMSDRRAPEVINKGGVQVRAVNPDSGRKLKIRSINKT